MLVADYGSAAVAVTPTFTTVCWRPGNRTA